MNYMARALQLASRALGTSSPNPAVGAVLVRDGQVVGEGATQPPGEAHAEIVALRAAGPLARGSTLYVTLEPCAHYGRTPPCVDAIVEAGIVETHVAMLDPSPWVDGHGIDVLERAGIRVHRGSHEREARHLNEAYLCWLLRGRPLVTALYALGLDGQPQPLEGASLSEPARAELARLRSTADRTLTECGPLLAGDPTLTGLAASGVTALHLEAHPGLLGDLLQRGLLDRVALFVTPTLGCADAPGDGSGAPGGTAAGGAHLGAGTLRDVTYERLGDTLLIRGRLPADLPADLGANDTPVEA